MKHPSIVAILALGLAGASTTARADTAPTPPATPEVTITGSAEIASQYRFRGISQSDNRPVVQGSITVTDKSGFYVSTWGSSATAGNSAVNIGGTEIDVFGGYAHTFKNGVTLDGGLYGYLYPGNPGIEYYEIYGDASKSFGPLGTKIGVNFAPNQHAFDSVSTHYSIYKYIEFTLSPPKLSALTLHSHIAHTGGGFDYTKAYIDYTAGVSYKWKSLTFDISAVGTNISKADAHAAPFPDQTGVLSPGETHRAAKSVAVLSVTASF